MEKKIPEIRFKGFEGEWEEEKLGKIGDTFSGLTGKTKVDFGHGDGKYITYMNVFTNTIANPKMTEPIEIDKSQNAVKAGDVLFTTSSETPEEVGMSSIWVENAENIYLNSFCFGFRPKIKVDNNYLAYVLRSNKMRKKITFLAQGISRYNISKNRVMEIDLPIPLDEEQTQIGTYFQNLDSLISLHQCKYDKLLTVKKAMLEKMFPKEGADVPEIRFKGFEGKWEKKKFQENIVSIQIGTNLLGLTTNTGMPLLKMGNIQRGYFSFDKLEFLDEKIEVEKENIAYYGDFLFNTRNTLELVGKGATWTGESGKFSFNSNIARFIFNGINTIFFNYLYNTHGMINQVHSRAMGTTSVAAIYPRNLNSIEYSLPIIEEQTKIGTFFQNLDALITQHQKQLEKLKNIKKACLEKMFV